MNTEVGLGKRIRKDWTHLAVILLTDEKIQGDINKRKSPLRKRRSKAPTREQIRVLKELYGRKRSIAVDFASPSGQSYPKLVRSAKYSCIEIDQMIEDMIEFGNSNNESIVTFKSIVEQLDIY